jgi:hypothetical protein
MARNVMAKMQAEQPIVKTVAVFDLDIRAWELDL